MDLRGIREGSYGWARSYTQLAKKYGVYFHVSNGSINDKSHGGSRTRPGRFGAKVSPLLPFLGEKHYGVKLPKEARHRMVLWLDANSEFYGELTRNSLKITGNEHHKPFKAIVIVLLRTLKTARYSQWHVICILLFLTFLGF